MNNSKVDKNRRGMTYTLTVYSDDVRLQYGDVCGFHTGDELIYKANEWAGKDNWNRLELTIEEGRVLLDPPKDLIDLKTKIDLLSTTMFGTEAHSLLVLEILAIQNQMKRDEVA